MVIIVVAAVAAYAYYAYAPGSTTTTPTTTTPTTSTSSTTTSSTTTPLTGSLNIITFTDPSNAWLTYAANQFKALHPGVTINVVAQGFSQYANTEATSLQTGSSTYDIITFTSTSALRFLPWVVNLNGLVNLNSTDIPAPQLDFGGIYKNTTTGQTSTIGVPYDTSTFTFFYNTKVFDNSALNSSFYGKYGVSLDPNHWTSWTNALDADNFLVNQTHQFANGITIDVSESHDIIDTFPAVFGYYYAHDSTISGSCPDGGQTNWNIMFTGCTSSSGTPAPSFNGTAGVQALQTLYQLLKYDPQPFSGINYGNVFASLQNNQSAGALMFTADATSLPNSTIKGEYGVATLPGGYAETGTDFYAVSKYSNNQALAEAFLSFLLSPSINQEIYYIAQEFPISKEATSLIAANSSLPQWERNIVQDVFNTGAEGWANPPNLTITSTELIPAFNQPVYNYFTTTNGNSTAAQEALNSAAAAWVTAVG